MAGRGAASRPRGRHFLASRRLAEEIVRCAGVGPGDLVLEIGAGTGLLTAALAERAGSVIVVELDPALARVLRRRFASASHVTVVAGDALELPLPREPFRVVANLPFDRTTDVLRRLLDDPRTALERADLVVEWGAALKRAAVWPSTLRGVLWGAWYELSISRHLPASAFRPPPAADAGVLVAVRRAEPLVPIRDAQDFGVLVARGFRRGLRSVASRRELRALGIPPDSSARELDVHQWAALHARRPADRLASPRHVPL